MVLHSDADQPKHRGLTYFIIDMQQPGVDIRPIKQMNAKSHFSEVFFTEARVSDADRISDVNGGWAVTLATLAYERAGLSAADGVSGVRPAAGEEAGLLDKRVGALIEHARATAVVADDAGGQLALLTQLTRDLGRSHDPIVRQQEAAAACRARWACSGPWKFVTSRARYCLIGSTP